MEPRAEDELAFAVRAFTTPALIDVDADDDDGRDRYKSLPDDLRYASSIMVLDTESTVEPSQRLLFASYRLFDVEWRHHEPRLSCTEEGLLHEDDLATWNPDGWQVLRDYVGTHAPAVDAAAGAASVIFHLRSREGFIKEVWQPYVYQGRAVAVFFNFGFDVSRLSVYWAPAGPRRPKKKEGQPAPKRKRSRFEGGFSLSILGRFKDRKWRDHPAYPRVLIKHIDSKRSLKALGSPAKGYANPEDLVYEEEEEPSFFRGHLLDLRTLTFALTDKGHTLESACAEFGVPYTKRKVTHGTITPAYVDYNREDTEATAKLWAAAMTEFVRHPIDLQATKAYSPATIGKAYLSELGATPPMQRLGATPQGLTWDDVFGFAMTSYFGGRAECRIRR